jgi:hypothetical protein
LSSWVVDTLFVINTSALWRTVQPTGKLVGDDFAAGRVVITPIIAWPSKQGTSRARVAPWSSPEMGRWSGRHQWEPARRRCRAPGARIPRCERPSAGPRSAGLGRDLVVCERVARALALPSQAEATALSATAPGGSRTRRQTKGNRCRGPLPSVVQLGHSGPRWPGPPLLPQRGSAGLGWAQR